MKRWKRTGILLTAFVYLLTSAGTVWAKTADQSSLPTARAAAASPSAEPSEASSPSVRSDPAVYLMIDSQNCYEGMEKPYAEGYMPKVENGFAHLVVPILATGELKNQSLQVSLDLGDSQGSPFVMKNYSKTIFLKSFSVNGKSMTVKSYVADFRLELKEKRNNGSYPVRLDVKGIAADGSTVSKEFRIYVTITDGNGNGASDSQNPSGGNASDSSGNGNGSGSAGADGGNGSGSSGTDGSGGDGSLGADGSNGSGSSGTDGSGGSSGTDGSGGSSGTDGADGSDGNGGSGADGSAGSGGDWGSGTDAAGGAGQGQEEPPSFAPKILVDSCRLTPENPAAGQEVTAEITLLNTSQKEIVKNMTITVSAASEYLTLTGTGDTIFVEKLSPRKTCTFSCQYQINAVAPQGLYELELSMEYADAKGNNYTAVRKVRLSSEQFPRMLFDPLAIPENLAVADVVEVSAQAINLGKTKVYNVRAVLEADGLTPSGTIFIGDMEPGTKASAVTRISVSGRTEGGSPYGVTEGTVTFYYEDEAGQEQSESMGFQTTIQSPFSPETPQEEDKTGQWWLIMAGTGGILLFFVAFLTGKRAGQRKS